MFVVVCIYYAVKNHGSNTFCFLADSTTIDTMNEYIQSINERTLNHGFRITVNKCEVTGVSLVSWIRTSLDESLQPYSNYTKGQEEYFKEILKEILLSSNKCIKYIFCINLSKSIVNTIAVSLAEKSLQEWVKEGYIVVKDNLVYLGARCLAEFNRYFSVNYSDDISTCTLCAEVAVFKLTCKNCRTHIHKHCLENYLENFDSCPSCNENWEVGGTENDSINESEIDSS